MESGNGEKRAREAAEERRTAYPMGLTPTASGFHVNVILPGDSCALVLYRRNERAPLLELAFPPEERLGKVWSLDVTYEELKKRGVGLKDLKTAEYNFRCGGRTLPDPCGLSFSGRDSYGKAEQYGSELRSPVFLKPFDWSGDVRPETPLEDSVIYRLHVRGFTKSRTSGVTQKGTFDGIIEKIPYLTSLGITAVELMPCQEFEELMMPRGWGGAVQDPAAAGRFPGGRSFSAGKNPPVKVNYWGYAPAYRFAPKASYCRRKGRDPAGEFRSMVRELHRAGIEVIPEFYFDGSENLSCVLEALRFWARFYRVDGFHITGKADLPALASDPYLSDLKLIAERWPDLPPDGSRRLASCSEDFEHEMRRVLKGDEGMLNALMFHTRSNPQKAADIKFMANTNGFTLRDAVSYEMRHNEANGEDNRDGTDFNYTWNCGAEGPTRKKSVRCLRKRQIRNAFLLLFLSQGTPLLLAGDEFGNSQGGNNNAYCQDNEVSWLDWRDASRNGDLLRFVKTCISFRKKHRAFHYAKEPEIMDPDGCGIPDISYHGTRAWQPEFEAWRRQLGILYSGHYAKDAEGKSDSSFYVMYNMHWEPHEFAIPHPERGFRWHIAADTSRDAGDAFWPEGNEPVLADQHLYLMPPRSIAVMISKPDPDFERNERQRRKADAEKSRQQSAERKKNRERNAAELKRLRGEAAPAEGPAAQEGSVQEI